MLSRSKKYSTLVEKNIAKRDSDISKGLSKFIKKFEKLKSKGEDSARIKLARASSWQTSNRAPQSTAKVIVRSFAGVFPR